MKALLSAALLLVASAAGAQSWDAAAKADELAAGARRAAADAPRLIPFTDAELLDYVYGQASARSGRPSLPTAQRPPVYKVSEKDLTLLACAESENSCRQLAAVFDDVGYRVLIREDLDLEDLSMLSYLIHETVHALQYRMEGPEIFRDCAAILKTETEAYGVQDQYLKAEGQFLRAGQVLRFFHCDEDVAAKDYAKSKAVWDARMRTGTFTLAAPGR